MSDDLEIRVMPNTVPTTSSPFHKSATHVDALGMPVAFSDDWPFHPTPCCGAAATFHDSDLCCKRCWEYVDLAFGNYPVEPYRPIEEVRS